MAYLFGESILEKQVPFSELLVGWIYHLLNTEMKTVMDSSILKSSVVCKEDGHVKNILSILKQSRINRKLPAGCEFLQEIYTRFGTIIDTVKRCLKFENRVELLLIEESTEAVSKASKNFHELHKDHNTEEKLAYPGLWDMIEVFSPVKHANNLLESNGEPGLATVLYIIQKLKSQMELLVFVVGHGSEFFIPHSETLSMAQLMLNELNIITPYDLYCAACVFQPGIFYLYFDSDAERNFLMEKRQ